jgi:hypothetical protein
MCGIRTAGAPNPSVSEIKRGRAAEEADSAES